MATLKSKYAGLPDVDDAPDSYETPELTDDNSTAPRTRAHSQSTTSSYKDFDENENDSPNISRSRLRPNDARSHFSPAVIDARDVDFSDRVTAKRKSYKTSTRRQRRKEDGTEEYGDFSDEEDGESLERRMARLQREIEELKQDYGKRKAEKGSSDGGETVNGEDIIALSKVLNDIAVTPGSAAASAGAKLAKDLGTGIKANGPPRISQESSEPATYTVTYAPVYQQSHALAKAADFDGRLALLEKALGLTSAIPSLNANGTPKSILPALDTLQRQLSVIAESTPAALDAVSRRVRTLTQEAERLEESRRSAKLAQDALRSTGESHPEEAEDSEMVSKVNALYGTLSTIENLAPLLPSLLDRLRSLRAIHADAATAGDSLAQVEKRQADMANDIKRWTEGLERVEEAIKQGETTMGGNMKIVEGWVKELEEKMAKA